MARPKTHGMSYTRPYKIWEQMKSRCKNPKAAFYQHYGGRGIRVCDEWKGFQMFWYEMKKGYAPHLTIDRIDNDGNYCKENCRWATMKEQHNNTGRHRFIKYKDITRNLTQWCEELGLREQTIRRRIDSYGWSVKDAFEIPIKKIKKNVKIKRIKTK